MTTENLVQDATEILSRFESTWTFDVSDLLKPSSEQVLKRLIEERPEGHRPRLQAEFFGLGPLERLFDDPGVNEIIINGTKQIWFEKAGTLTALEDTFLTEVTFKSFIDRLCAEAGIKIDLEVPFANGRWASFRVHLACAPLANRAYHLTLRRVPENPWTIKALGEADWCTPRQQELLLELIDTRKNVLIVGPTGCGKTTVLGACLKTLPANERVVIIEDTDELAVPNLASTKLLARPALSDKLGAIDLSELLRQSLRMRPFRLVVGEVRGGEAKDLLLALATGHGGSWGTLHASDARQALLRLEMLVQMGAPQWSLPAIRQLLHLSVDAIIVCGNHGGRRRLEGVYKIAALESFGFLMETMV